MTVLTMLFQTGQKFLSVKCRIKALKILSKMDEDRIILRCKVDYVEQVYTMPVETFVVYATGLNRNRNRNERRRNKK